MTQHVKQPIIFSQTELDNRKENAKQKYLQGFDSVLRHETPSSLFANKLFELYEQGYKVATQAKSGLTFGGGVYFYVLKTDEQQEEDLSKIYSDLEEHYLQEIE